MRMIATAIFSVFALSSAALAGTFSFDLGHTQVRASWTHAGFSEQSVLFHQLDGTVEFDPENAAATKANVTIDLTSLDTGVAPFDAHMKSGDMFGVDANPTATFASTSAEITGDRTATVTGDLTIKGITKPVTLDVVVHNYGDHPLGQFMEGNKGTWLGMTLTGTLVRSEWDLGYGAPLMSDEVKIFISTEMKQN